uniref:AB hydrolase-1 domain-containing protein n=1 Tax=Globisporangium ultimum (strain ATCC 200006 / CBS 805.95 / DAOM BR144) TaxID=431595 RepID=K3X731_GLOUD
MRRTGAWPPSRVFSRAFTATTAAGGGATPPLARRSWIAHRTCGQQHRPLLCSNGARSFVSFIPKANPSVPREHRPPPPPLPEPQHFHLEHENCTIEYIDIKPVCASAAAKDEVTMVLVHGAPGTYHDFRHIIPLLQQQRESSTSNMRIIGINLPGFGRSTVDKTAYLDQISAVPAAKLTLQALQALCTPTENVFVMGHSFGAHAAFNLTALNQELRNDNRQQQVNFKGMVLLAPAGCRPHRVLRPKENAMVIRLLRSSNPLVTSMLTQAIKFLYTRMLGFSRENPASHFVAGIVRAGTTDFRVVTDHVLATRSTIPSFIAWSSSDEYMEGEIPVELAQMCHPGPRIAFTGGGHNIQKTRADFLADQVLAWVRQVLHSESKVSNKSRDVDDVQVVP